MVFEDFEIAVPKRDNSAGPTASIVCGNRLRRLVGLGVALPICFSSTIFPDEAARAQESDEEQLEEIVVTGRFQRSLQDALDEKREASEIIEALSAEDIGSLPDTSVAESLARLPGVSHTRNAFGASGLSIRGLGSILTSTTLNDRDLASEWGDRSISFNLFPAELISRATVYKAPSASHVEGGIGGTVNLQTARALDWGERAIALNFRGRYNDLGGKVPEGESTGYRGSATYVDQFADDTLGVALGYAGQFAPLVSASTYIYESRTVEWGGFIEGLPGAGGGSGPTNDFNVPYGGESSVLNGTSDRHSVLGTLQWRPSGTFEMNFDGFFSTFEQEGWAAGLSLGGLGTFGNRWEDVEVDGFNIVGATVECLVPEPTQCLERGWGQDLSAINAVDNAGSQLHSYGAGGHWTRGSVTLFYDVSWSRANAENEYATVQYRPYRAGPGPAELIRPVASFGENEAGAGFVTTPLDFLDPSSNRLDSFFVIDDTRTDDILTYKADLEFALGSPFFTAVTAGARFVNRDNELIARRTRVPPGDAGPPVPIDPQHVIGVLDQSEADTAFDTTPILVLDAQAVREAVFPTIRPQVLPSSGHYIEEDVSAVYSQMDFETGSSGLRIAGNFGVRVVRTDVHTRGTASIDDVPAPIRTSDSYTEALPSANVNFFPRDDFIVRLAASRAIARPAVTFLSPGTDQYGDTIYGGVNGGGNPYLRPFVADQVDLSFEKYFDEDTALAVALFGKEMDTFITQSRTVAGPPDHWISYIPANGNGGGLVGLEVTFQHNFMNLLPPQAGTVGIYATYSYTDSDIELTETFNSSTFGLDGQSDHVGNVTLHYFRNRFSARLSYRYRSEFTRPQRPARAFTTNAAEGDLSFQVSVDASDRLNFYLEGWNMTNEPRDNYYGLESLQGAYGIFGRNLQFGLTYRP